MAAQLDKPNLSIPMTIGPGSIGAIDPSVTGFVGRFAKGPLNQAVLVADLASFSRRFGRPQAAYEAALAVQQFFLNGGRQAWIVRVGDGGAKALIGSAARRSGLFALDQAVPLGLLLLPDCARLTARQASPVMTAALEFCRRQAVFYILDLPQRDRARDDVGEIKAWLGPRAALRDSHVAVHAPRLVIKDPAKRGRLVTVSSGGSVAGIYARTDLNGGVWKAPAGPAATLKGVERLARDFDQRALGALTRLGVNRLRQVPGGGPVVWGARSLAGQTSGIGAYKYVAVRRLALMIEQSLYLGLQWAVFEPNGGQLLAQIRLNVSSFLHHLFCQGAFQGTTSREAYYVRCDPTTTSQQDIADGKINLQVGFAPLRPAEFVVLHLTLSADSP